MGLVVGVSEDKFNFVHLICLENLEVVLLNRHIWLESGERLEMKILGVSVRKN